jgi:1-acyl-sn-glycerol-3-phosphate acyltransferase
VTILRSALFALGLILVTPPYALLALLTFPLPRMARYRIISGWSRLVVFLAKTILGIDWRVEGRENLPSRPSVILAKHQSAWETMAFQLIFPPQVLVLKRELLWIPFFGWGLALMSPIAINRANRKRAMRRMIELGGERFRQGFSIMVYPEGTRIAVGRRGVYKLGGAVLAVENGTRALPVAHNAGLVWPRNSFLKYPGKITVIVGPPIETTGLTAEQVMRRAEDWIEGEMTRIAPSKAFAKTHATQAPVSL